MLRGGWWMRRMRVVDEEDEGWWMRGMMVMDEGGG